MSRTITAVAIASLVLVGCGPKGPPPAEGPAPPREGCSLLPGEARPATLLRIGLTQPVNPVHAPDPENEAERLVFRHLYETLIAVDCEGKVSPSLASSWSVDEGGRVVTFVLRDGARFSDGTPVTAAAVREAWVRGASRAAPGEAPWTWVRPESVRILAPDRFSVSLTRTLGPRPLVFADPALAVSRGGGVGGWRFGTGPYTLSLADENAITLAPNPDHPEESRGLSPLRFEIRLKGDPRDLLSQGVDLLVVTDRSALEYAQELPDHVTSPLGYSRLYFLASPRLPLPASSDETARGLERLRLELALHVTGTDTRPARYFHFDADEGPDCPPRRSGAVEPPPASADTLRILYPSDDPDAGRITARLVALNEPGASIPPPLAWGPPPGGDPVAASLPADAFAAALRGGRDAAYVFSIRRDFPDPCLDREALFGEVPWLRCAAGDCGEGRGSGTLVPLVVSRGHLVARRDVAGVAVDWDGVPLLTRAGRGPGGPKA